MIGEPCEREGRDETEGRTRTKDGRLNGEKCYFGKPVKGRVGGT